MISDNTMHVIAGACIDVTIYSPLCGRIPACQVSVRPARPSGQSGLAGRPVRPGWPSATLRGVPVLPEMLRQARGSLNEYEDTLVFFKHGPFFFQWGRRGGGIYISRYSTVHAVYLPLYIYSASGSACYIRLLACKRTLNCYLKEGRRGTQPHIHVYASSIYRNSTCYEQFSISL